jgi:hypothetical protein
VSAEEWEELEHHARQRPPTSACPAWSAARRLPLTRSCAWPCWRRCPPPCGCCSASSGPVVRASCPPPLRRRGRSV